MAGNISDGAGITIVKDGMETITEILRLFANLAVSLDSHSYSPNNKNDKNAGYKQLSDYSKKQGNRRDALISDKINGDKADIFEKMLQYHNVPYIATPAKDVDGSDVCFFVTRDIDRGLVQSIRNQYLKSFDRGSMEIPLQELKENHKNGKLLSYDNLSPAELEVFRHHITQDGKSLQYGVELNRDGTSNIHFANSDIKPVKHALLATAFDLSGRNGEQYKADINAFLHQKQEFRNNMVPENDNEMLYIMDSNNPKNFITVTNKEFIKHEIKTTTIDKENNIHYQDPVDKASSPEPSQDRDSLYEAVSQLNSPVILKQSEVESLYLGLNGQRQIQFTQTEQKAFDTSAEDFRKNTLSRGCVEIDGQKRGLIKLDKHPIHSMLRHENDAYTIKLPKDRAEEIKKAINAQNLERVAVVGDVMAYAGADRIIVDETLAKTLYNGKQGIELICDKVKYEERGSLDLANPGNEQFIVNLDLPQFVFHIKPENVGVINTETGQEMSLSTRESDTFSKDIINYCTESDGKTLQNIIVLTPEQYNSPDRNTIIEQMNPATRHMSEKSFVMTGDKEREMYFKGACNTQRQGAAVNLIKSKWAEPSVHEVTANATYKVDKTITEKIATFSTERKTVVDGNPSQSASSRSVNSTRSTSSDISHS